MAIWPWRKNSDKNYNNNNKTKQNKNPEIHSGRPAISNDPVGLGMGGGFCPPLRRLRINNSRREVAQSVSQETKCFLLCLFSTQADVEQQRQRSRRKISPNSHNV